MNILKEIRSCNICNNVLPLPPKPLLQVTRISEILIVGKAPGLRAHETGRPWNDPSGVRLRDWLEMKDEEFYDVRRTAIIPLVFCYPGRGKSGDNPPRPECRARWMDSILAQLVKL